MKYDLAKHSLQFKFDAGTSRGVLKTKDSWFIKLADDNRIGIGECGILKGLSIENYDNYQSNLIAILGSYTSDNQSFNWDISKELPSIRFGLEIAERDLANSGSGILFHNAFSRGEANIPINGLVWMGTYQFMYDQIRQKIEDGYGCIKIKIGAIDFEKEIELLKYIRSQFSKKDIELRVDANGAFQPNEALEKLQRLSQFDIHSIEQPIRQGQWEAMAALCAHTPLDIALDEELIGVHDLDQREKLLDIISPQYIILKPSLVGGYVSSEEWIKLSDDRNIKYWITSALESNIGLNAIAQWTYDLGIDMPQGLGTGQLYHNNIEGPLYIANGHLCYDPNKGMYDNFELF